MKERNQSVGLPGVISAKRTATQKLIKAMDQEDFRTDLMKLKQSIAIGRTLEESRLHLKIYSKKRWELLTLALGRMTIQREKLFMEFHSRIQIRYHQATEMMNRHAPYVYTNNAKTDNPKADPDMESKMLILLCKLDEQVVELADKMGLLKPTQDGDTGGEGFHDDQLRAELERITRTIENQISGKRDAVEPIYIGSQPEPHVERAVDQLEKTTVDASDPGGQVSDN